MAARKRGKPFEVGQAVVFSPAGEERVRSMPEAWGLHRALTQQETGTVTDVDAGDVTVEFPSGSAGFWPAACFRRADNVFRAGSSASKLRGEYYTPPSLIRCMLDAVSFAPGDRLLDPACGDGEFLVQGVHWLAKQLSGSPTLRAATLLESVAGLDLFEEEAATSRERVAAAIREVTGVDVAPEQVNVRQISGLELNQHPRQALGLGQGRLLVLGNPPYVESKRLSGEERARLKQRFPEATKGAPDLYLYFIHACLGWLEGKDRMALVLPNKMLVNTNARAQRQRLLRENRLLGVDFATTTGVFEGASVYPIVLYAGPEAEFPRQLALSRLEREGDALRTVALPPVDPEAYTRTHAQSFFPTPDNPKAAQALLKLVEQIPHGRLADVMDLRWSVSYHRRGLREQYVSAKRPDSPHARPFLGGLAFAGNGEVARYRIEPAGWWIDYDTERLAQDRNPLPPVELFERPKIVICQNARTLRAAYDESGAVLKDIFLCGCLREVEHPLVRQPRALVGLLCSGTAHFFYSHVFHGGHVNGGYLHFLQSFLNDMPLGEWTEATAAEIAGHVSALEGELPPQERDRREQAIEVRVEVALGVPAVSRGAVRNWLKEDANWQARERIRRRDVAASDHASA